MASAIEAWLEVVRDMEAAVEDWHVSKMVSITALERVMALGEAQRFYESRQDQRKDYEEVLYTCKDYATRASQEHNHKRKDNTDVDEVHEGRWQVEAGGGLGRVLGWESTGESGQRLVFMNKGKSKDEGKYGIKGLGKE